MRSVARHLRPVGLLLVLIGTGDCAGGGRSDHAPPLSPSALSAASFDVRRFGARGDGASLDTAAVNAAITAAHAAGGGTVCFAAGNYPCHSIHLQSNVTLYLEAGATLTAAPTVPNGAGYDPPEPNAFDPYQDFGHSHFRNSLICGEGLTNVAILGRGTIDGTRGLSRGVVVRSRRVSPKSAATTTRATEPGDDPSDHVPYPDPREALPAGVGNKAISLKLCRGVLLRDFTIRAGGHFGILATGCENVAIDDLRIDTDRDGMDVDSCRGVRISNCTVNSPRDDGICLKADFALGYNLACEDVTITNCQVSGWRLGSMLDGRRLPAKPSDDSGRGGGTGRIKLGTESNGDFRNITISNCVFDHCHGLALETVDGASLVDVTVTNVTMRHVANSPIFLRLGSRLRGPRPSTIVGKLARVNISNVVVYDADPKYASIISGIPGHDVTDVKISNVQIFSHGGGPDTSKGWAAKRPSELVDGYPEPERFGATPAYGFYVRHATGIEFNNVALHVAHEDVRPAFFLDQVSDVKFVDVDAQQSQGVPPLSTSDAHAITIRDFPGATAPPGESRP